MTQPANIRVNIGAPFPSLVKGAAPFAITRANGIWTLGFSMAGLQAAQPPSANYPTDYLLVWDSLTGLFFRMPLAALPSAGGAQRSIAVAGDLPLTTTDLVLNINAVTDLAPLVTLAAFRAGISLTFKNMPGSHAQTLTATSPDTFDGFTTYVLITGASVTLVPYNDGVNNALGYAIES